VAAGHRSGGVAGCGSFAPELIARARHSQAGAIAPPVIRQRMERGSPAVMARQPFGVIYSTNITADPKTGIGAMHEGVSRNGSHLFPVFSYDHISGLSDDDVRALYAYFMTRTPVHASARPSGIPFPFNIRYLQAGWKLLLFRPSRFEPGAEKAHFWKHKTCRVS